MNFPRTIAKALSLLSLLHGCASGLVSLPAPPSATGKRTVVLFLVDGLSSRLLKANLEHGRMAHTRDFFLQGRSGFRLARAGFPSLTYPNIASILTGRRIGEQPVISNQVVESGKIVNFEQATSHSLLREKIDPISVFGVLEGRGKRSASFSYVFGQNASEHMQFGIREGLEYKTHSYRKLDDRLIANMENFLSANDPEHWPEFVYIHLVGVDGTIHRHGQGSREAKEYLAWLDFRLRRVYRILQRAEASGHGVISMLTADHGFSDTKATVSLEGVIKKADSRILVTNESRFLGLHFPPGAPIRSLLRKLRAAPGVELTALRNGSRIEIEGRSRKLQFAFGPAACEGEAFTLALLPKGKWQPASSSYQCPDFYRHSSPYPFLVPDLALFLSIPKHPDAVVIAKPGFSFTSGFKANHGGPTAEEILVPLLLRGASVRENELLRTSELLEKLGS